MGGERAWCVEMFDFESTNTAPELDRRDRRHNFRCDDAWHDERRNEVQARCLGRLVPTRGDDDR